MAKFIIGIPEEYTQYREVEAETPEEACDLALKGLGKHHCLLYRKCSRDKKSFEIIDVTTKNQWDYIQGDPNVRKTEV